MARCAIMSTILEQRKKEWQSLVLIQGPLRYEPNTLVTLLLKAAC